MSTPPVATPLVIVSADGHAAPPLEGYRDYLPAERHADLDDFIAEEGAAYDAMLAAPAFPGPEERAIFDHRDALGSGGTDGSWSWQRRRAEMDVEGCAAEIVHSGTQASPALWYGVVNRPRPAELRWQGVQAYHRWLADMMADAGGRMHGVAEPGPCLDLDATVRELRWAAEHRFVSVGLPGITADPALPPLYDAHFEPFWSACEELGLVLSMHAGWGQPQGVFYEFFDQARAQMAASDNPMEAMAQIRDRLKSGEESPLRLDAGPRRAMWQLMAGGVFDRHPRLRLAMTEIRADWVPATLAFLDRASAERGIELARKPSEYFQLHCAVAASSIHRAEVEMRHEIGLTRLLFGADYPHHEGTWPNTLEWIGVAFDGVPEDEARLILGENAIELYGLDRAAVEAVAARIGPDPSILREPPPVPDAVIGHFDKRAGFSRPPADLSPTDLVSALDTDPALLAARA